MTMHCDVCCPVDWAAARRAAAALLSGAKVDLYKALDPLKDDDFILLAQQLADQLDALAGPPTKKAVQSVLRGLDVDFANLSTPQATELARAANLALRDIPRKVMPKISGEIRAGMAEMVGSTKVAVARSHNWSINTSLDAVDERMALAMGNIGTWVTDEFNRRADMFSQGTSRVIQQGLAEGLRNEDIARNLKLLGEKTHVRRSENYWRLVATNASNRARNYGHIRSMVDAGVSSYRYSAVMDKRTSMECRSLDGTVFPVSAAVKAYNDLEFQTQNNPSAVESVMPFVRRRSLGNGVTELFVEPPGSGRTVIAQAIGSAVGTADVRGTFTNMLGPQGLAAAGVIVPPIHHGCRSTLVPEI